MQSVLDKSFKLLAHIFKSSELDERMFFVGWVST